jgi:hypothetical protein
MDLDARSAPAPDKLPEILRPLFWDCDFDQLTWSEHRDFVVGRVLSAGSWNAIDWLRARHSDLDLRQWIERRQGRGLTPQQLRFWELVLEMPSTRIDAWLESPGRRISEGSSRR